MQLLFWTCAGLILYTYALYPLGLVLFHAGALLLADFRYLSRSGDRRATDPPALPRVSILIAAYNEEQVIGAKIANALALDYPEDRLEIIVGLDGCTDRSEAVVRAVGGERVEISAGPRAGKASVLDRIAPLAGGEILVFTDANTVLERAALRKLVRHFQDPRVGLVCGRLRLFNRVRQAYEESAYWRYENLIKFYESKLGVVMGANGGLYAMRRSGWRPLGPSTVVDDFVTAMRVLAGGRAVRYEPEAVAHEETTEDYSREFRRRARIAAGNFLALRSVPLLLSPRAGLPALALWSHKVLRWLVPLWMAGALVANAVLAARSPYGWLLAGQLAFYAMAGAGALGLRMRAASMARYLVIMNAALAVGMARFALGRQQGTWERTAR